MVKKPVTLEDLAGMVQRGFSEVDGRFDKIEGRLDKVEGTMEDMLVRMDKFQKGQKQLFAIVSETPSPESFLKLETKVLDLNKRVNVLERR